MHRNFSIDDKVVIQPTKTIEDIYESYELAGRIGEVRRIFTAGDRCYGVHIPGEYNESTDSGYFWLDKYSIELFEAAKR